MKKLFLLLFIFSASILNSFSQTNLKPLFSFCNYKDTLTFDELKSCGYLSAINKNVIVSSYSIRVRAGGLVSDIDVAGDKINKSALSSIEGFLNKNPNKKVCYVQIIVSNIKTNGANSKNNSYEIENELKSKIRKAEANKNASSADFKYIYYVASDIGVHSKEQHNPFSNKKNLFYIEGAVNDSLRYEDIGKFKLISTDKELRFSVGYRY